MERKKNARGPHRPGFRLKEAQGKILLERTPPTSKVFTLNHQICMRRKHNAVYMYNIGDLLIIQNV